VFDVSKTRVVTKSNEASGSGTSGDWDKIEEMALGTWDRKGKKPLRLLPDDKRLSVSVESEFSIISRDLKYSHAHTHVQALSTWSCPPPTRSTRLLY
jgi:hypothetical protein